MIEDSQYLCPCDPFDRVLVQIEENKKTMDEGKSWKWWTGSRTDHAEVHSCR